MRVRAGQPNSRVEPNDSPPIERPVCASECVSRRERNYKTKHASDPPHPPRGGSSSPPLEIVVLSHPHNQCAKGAQKVTTPSGRNRICHRTVSQSSTFSPDAARNPNHHRRMPRRGRPQSAQPLRDGDWFGIEEAWLRTAKLHPLTEDRTLPPDRLEDLRPRIRRAFAAERASGGSDLTRGPNPKSESGCAGLISR
jgi:hypothetical protein